MGVAATEVLDGASIALDRGGDVLVEETADLSPGAPFVADVDLPAGTEETALTLRVRDGRGHEVIRYTPREVVEPPLPEPKTPPPPPETFETNEELYLTGLHLSQYRHPTIEPEPYWEAALAQDPTDVRCNNAMGQVRYRQGEFDEAAAHFQAAIDTLTRRNPNPRDGEAFYNLGLTFKAMGRLDEAYGKLYKATWDFAWQTAAFYALAEIDCRRRDFETALDHLDRSLRTNAMNLKARNLKAAALRHLGRLEEAAAVIEGTRTLDPLDMGSRNEAVLLSRARGDDAEAFAQREALAMMMDVPHWLSRIQAHLDLAFDYLNAGLWEETRDVLTRLVAADGSAYPMVLYVLGYVAAQQGDEEAARTLYERAGAMNPEYCFPSRLEEMRILEHAQSQRPDDPWIAYYLGTLLYDRKRYDEAIALWERSAAGIPDFSIPRRNLGIAYFNVQDDPDKAIASYETAFSANPGDGRLLSELDQLRRRTGVAPEARLAALEAHMPLVRSRDDLSVEITTLYNLTGQPQKALDYVLSRRFHPWEGGTGLISRQYVKAHLLLGKEALAGGDADAALTHFESAQATYPENLGERKHLNWADADVHYYTGVAKQRLGDESGARESFRRVLAGRDGEVSEAAYYRGLALRAMGRDAEADAALTALLERARERREEQARREFATSVPEFVFTEVDAETRRRIHLTYLIGLAHLGLGHEEDAEAAFRSVLDRQPGHVNARLRLRDLGASP
jgi:tetratricopeptide (TPR) repeat protein